MKVVSTFGLISVLLLAACAAPVDESSSTGTAADDYITSSAGALCQRPVLSDDGASIAILRCADEEAKKPARLEIHDLEAFADPQKTESVASPSAGTSVFGVTPTVSKLAYVTSVYDRVKRTSTWKAHVYDRKTHTERVSAPRTTTGFPEKVHLVASPDHVLVEADGVFDVALAPNGISVGLGQRGVEVARDGKSFLSYGGATVARARYAVPSEALEVGPSYALPETRAIVPGTYADGAVLLSTVPSCTLSIGGMTSVCKNESAAALFVFDAEVGSTRVLASGAAIRFVAETPKGVYYAVRGTTGAWTLERVLRSGVGREVLYTSPSVILDVVLRDDAGAAVLEGDEAAGGARVLVHARFGAGQPTVALRGKIAQIKAAGPNVLVIGEPMAGMPAKDEYSRLFALVDRDTGKGGVWSAYNDMAIAASADGSGVCSWDSQKKALLSWKGKGWSQLLSANPTMSRFDSLAPLPKSGCLLVRTDVSTDQYLLDLAQIH